MEVLQNPESSITERYRALYKLKEQKGDDARENLVAALKLTNSVLLLHEICFALGQRGDKASSDVLLGVLQDRAGHDEVTRHEAGEALGAIGDANLLPSLDAVAADSTESQAVRETCELAAARIRLLRDAPHEFAAQSAFESVDPAPAFLDSRSVQNLQEVLTDAGAPLFDRYRAMFALRNMANDDSAKALCVGLLADKSSALFRHEVAYVLGQLELPSTSAALSESLQREAEHPMVRHEAAEALGSVASQDTLGPLLTKYASHQEPLVAESCVVALDMMEYWASWKPQAGDGEAKP